MRLVGGNNTREGRVEVCFGETWATICDAFWSTADANVVCQQLGYSSNGRNVTVFMYEYKFLTDILQFSRDTSDLLPILQILYSCANFCCHCFCSFQSFIPHLFLEPYRSSGIYWCIFWSGNWSSSSG